MISLIHILHQPNTPFSKTIHELHLCGAPPADSLCKGAVFRLR